MKALNLVTHILVVIGAINWGLWGFFQLDLVAYLFGGQFSTISRVVYAVVGLAGVLEAKRFVSCYCGCSTKKGGGCC
jgi:uncharacterized membrane protein YuzA (DUF378 family)